MSLVVRVVRVALVRVVAQVRFSASASVAGVMSLVVTVVRVTLVGVVGQVRFSASSSVPTTARHDDQIIAVKKWHSKLSRKDIYLTHLKIKTQ